MTQDEIYIKQAKSLAHTAARAIEEAYSYLDAIEDETLRLEIEEELDRIIEEA